MSKTVGTLRGSLFVKILFLGIIALVLVIALSQVHSLVKERVERRNEVTQRFASGFGSEQTLSGPLLVIPVVERFKVVTEETINGKEVKRSVQRTVPRTLYVMPSELEINGKAPVQIRNVDLYNIPLYTLEAKLAGRYELPNIETSLSKVDGHIGFEVGTPYIALSISDPRGLRGFPVINVAGKSIQARRSNDGFAPARSVVTDTARVSDQVKDAAEAATAAVVSAARAVQDTRPALRADLTDIELKAGSPLAFSFDLAFSGTNTLSIQSPAEKTQLHLQSNWQHPKLDGLLPQERANAEQGLNAHWQYVSSADRVSIASQLINYGETVTVGFIDPVDIYRLSDRATKYGVLFVCIVLAAFFFFEVLRQLPVHPVQYGLVGAAVSIFFLLLLALSEHIQFAIAYSVSASACIGLIVLYLAAPLRSWVRAFVFGGKLILLFAALYGLLLSTDNALMLGALLLFGLLAVAMLGTRKVDWYGLTQKPAPQNAA